MLLPQCLWLISLVIVVNFTFHILDLNEIVGLGVSRRSNLTQVALVNFSWTRCSLLDQQLRLLMRPRWRHLFGISHHLHFVTAIVHSKFTSEFANLTLSNVRTRPHFEVINVIDRSLWVARARKVREARFRANYRLTWLAATFHDDSSAVLCRSPGYSVFDYDFQWWSWLRAGYILNDRLDWLFVTLWRFLLLAITAFLDFNLDMLLLFLCLDCFARRLELCDCGHHIF